MLRLFNIFVKSQTNIHIKIKNLKDIDYKFTKKVLTIFLIIKFPNIVFTNKTEYNEKLEIF